MSKKNETIETPIIEVENDDKCEQGCVLNIKNMDIKDLNAYEEACKNICILYEREIKLNEMEPKNYAYETITYNRGKFQKFTTIHRRIREIIENKLENLTEYEGW